MADRIGSEPPKMHGYIEVTVAAAMMLEDGSFLHGDMADVTLAFGLPTKQPPHALSEQESRETIRVNLGRLAATIEACLLTNGAMHLGQVNDPMTQHSREVGQARTDPVTVHVSMVEEGRS